VLPLLSSSFALASTSKALALCQLTLAAEGGTTDSVVLFDRRDFRASQPELAKDI
jgi:hypothetical protein